MPLGQMVEMAEVNLVDLPKEFRNNRLSWLRLAARRASLSAPTVRYTQRGGAECQPLPLEQARKSHAFQQGSLNHLAGRSTLRCGTTSTTKCTEHLPKTASSRCSYPLPGNRERGTPENLTRLNLLACQNSTIF